MPLAGDGTNLYPLRRTRRCVSRPATWRKKAGLGGSYGGITFDVPVAAQALDAAHFMYDEAAQYSMMLDMFSRDPNATYMQRTGSDKKQWTLRAPMLALRASDPVAGLPAGTLLQPMIFVRNTTAKQISADIALNWRGDSGKGEVKLPELEIAPFATQQLPIGAMQKQFGIPDDAHWALVTLTTAAQPDDLIAVASSRDLSGRSNVETKFNGGLGSYFAGGEWRSDATHNHLIVVTNSGIKPAQALLTLHYDNGRKMYEMQQTIQPSDQMWVNLADVIRQRIPDRKGNLLPTDVTSGTYDLHDVLPEGHSLLSSSLAVNTTLGYQAVQPCTDCCGVWSSSVSLEPWPLSVTVLGVDNLAVDATNVCNGQVQDISGAFLSWSSSDAFVAKVTKQQAQGMATGTATGEADGEIEIPEACECGFQASKPTDPITVPPTVTISGSTYIAMLKSGAQGSDSTTLTATGSPSGGTYSWTAVSGQGNITILNATSQSAIIQSVAVGTYTVQVTYTVNNQPGTATTVGKVQQPGSLGVISNDTQLFGCTDLGPPGSYNTQERLVQYQVLDM